MRHKTMYKTFSGRRPYRPSRSKGPNRPMNRSKTGRGLRGENINIARFINKAEITEKVERFVPEHAFSDFKIEEILKTSVVAKGYTEPTPIQDRIIPHVLRGADVVGIANTGTGKTAAFLIPLIQKVIQNPRSEILVVVPTRELAQQIDQELRSFCTKIKVYSTVCVGGAPMGRQISDLRMGQNFVIGTPGRLKDLIEKKCINLATFKTIVLDEADRMLDMGFINDMRSIMAKLPKERQTLFFSATISKDIEWLIKDFLREPVTISVKTRDTAQNVDQDIVKVTHPGGKIDVLKELLSQPEFSKVLVFGRTKHGVEKLSRLLASLGFKAGSIHGNKNQSQRQNTLGLFKQNHIQILVATDVAARGLDIPDVSHVINFDIPATYDDYVHRIGRTGRGDKKGKALTFVE